MRIMKIATHNEDIDGIVSAALFLIKYPDAEIRFLSVQQARETEEFFDFVVDLPKTKNCSVNIDHHETNYKLLRREGLLSERDIIDPSAPSTASLVIKVLGLEDDNTAKQLVNMANLADTGRLDERLRLLDCVIKLNIGNEKVLRKIAEILAKRGSKFDEDPWLKRELKKVSKLVQEVSERLMTQIDQLVKSGVKYAVLDCRNVPFFIVKEAARWFLNRGGKAVAVIYIDPNSGKDRVSIRLGSETSLSASELAEKIGGGGHLKAAGAVLEKGGLERAVGILIQEFSREGFTVIFRKITI